MYNMRKKVSKLDREKAYGGLRWCEVRRKRIGRPAWIEVHCSCSIRSARDRTKSPTMAQYPGWTHVSSAGESRMRICRDVVC